MLSRLLVLATAALGLASASARPLWQLTPEQLWPKAEVIVIGQVVDVQLTKETRELKLEGNAPVPVRVAKAHIRTLGVNKGELAFQFEFRFLTLNTDRPIVNGPVLTEIHPNGRYRFYLRKNGDHYVGVLDGEFDDGYAVQLLASEEGNHALPTFDRDASPLARSEFRRLRPGSVIYASTPTYHPQGGWTYYFYCRPPLQYPTYAFEAEININGARKFGRRSWVGKETPRPAAKFTPDDVGPRVRLTVDGDYRNGAFYASQGVVMILLGQLEKADDKVLVGTFNINGSTELVQLTIPREKLLSVQQIFPADKIGSP